MLFISKILNFVYRQWNFTCLLSLAPAARNNVAIAKEKKFSSTLLGSIFGGLQITLTKNRLARKMTDFYSLTTIYIKVWLKEAVGIWGSSVNIRGEEGTYRKINDF